jgi:hypothetical protein
MSSVSDWSLKVGDEEYNHEIVEASQGHKFVGRLRPKENRLFCELTGENKLSICLDEIHAHWKRLLFEADNVANKGQLDIFSLT